MGTGYRGMPASVAAYTAAHHHTVGGMLPNQHPAPTQEPTSGGGGSGGGGGGGPGAAAGDGEPSPQIQPSPSPTGSVTSSRSMSPAVGQQGVPLPAPPMHAPNSQEPPAGMSRPPHPLQEPAGIPRHPADGPHKPPPPPPGSGYPAPYGYPPRPHPHPQPHPHPHQHQGQYGHPAYAQGQYGRPGQPPPGHYPYQPQPHYTQHWPASQPGPVGSPSSRPPPLQGAQTSHYLRQQLQQRMQYAAGSNGPAPPSAMPPPASLPSASGPPPPPPHLPHPPQLPPRPTSQGSDGSQHWLGAVAAQQEGLAQVAVIGPDGVPIDDASQHSTLSNTSATSEDRSRSPRPRLKEPSATTVGGSQPPTPLSGLTSPGGASLLSAGHEESENGTPSLPSLPSPSTAANPAWARSPVTAYNPAPTRDAFPVSKKAESLNRLYELDDTPGRREWVARLLSLMEERGAPIVQCPTVSKQPLDLFKFYRFAMERGGFIEVTKNKGWKGIATALGVGGSSSGAYTLRKHYMKSLIYYEYLIDRGGQDPAPVLAKYETRAGRKKRDEGSPAPQEGYANSGGQDRYPGGYPGYQGTADFSAAPHHPQQPPPHSYGGYPPPSGARYQPGYGHYPAAAVTPPGGGPPPPAPPPPPPPPPTASSQPPAQAPYHPQYNRSYQGAPTPAAPPAESDYPRYPGPPPGPPTYGTRHPYGEEGGPPAPPSSAPGAPANNTVAANTEDTGNAQILPRYGAPASPGAPASSQPGAPPAPANTPPTQAAGPQPPPASQPHQPYRWRRYGPFGSGGQGGDPRAPYPQATAHWNGGGPVTPPPPPRMPGRRAQDKEPPPPTAKAAPPLTFPPDSVEATPPVLAKRRRGRRADVCPVDGWRLTLALRSGQLAESCWALDVLQILSFDDRTITWLDLAHMPGLLSALLEHFHQCLSVMFAQTGDPDAPGWYEEQGDGMRQVQLPENRPVDLADKYRVLSGANYTHVTRRGRIVTQKDCEGDILAPHRAATVDLLCDQTDEAHLQTHIRVETGRVPFVRRLPDGVGAESLESAVGVQREINDDGAKDTLTSGLTNGQVLEGFQAPDFFLSRLRKNVGVVNDSGCGDFTFSCDPSEGKRLKQSNVECDTVKLEAAQVMHSSVIQNPAESNGQCEPGSRMDTEAPLLVNGITTPPEQHDTSLQSDQPASTSRLQVMDPAGVLKRKRPDEEDECVQFDDPSLYLTTDTQESIARRCLAVSTVLRNVSFVPGNEPLMATEPVLALLADLLLLHHRHPARAAQQHNYDRDEDADFEEACAELSRHHWWAEYLPVLHENSLVTLTNVAGFLCLDALPEGVVRPLLESLLHWLQCPASYATDPAARSPSLATSLQQLSLETLCRLCLRPANVDLLLATPDVWLLRRLCQLAADWTAHGELPVRRELTLSLLHYLSSADERVAVLLAQQPNFVATLVRFIETAEQAAMGVASSQGVSALRDNPDLMGTNVDMLSRAAHVLLSMARVPGNRAVLASREHQLLQLVMSQILDQRVAAVLSQVLYEISQPVAQAACGS